MASDMGGIEFPVEDVDMSLEGPPTRMSTAPVTPPHPNRNNPSAGPQWLQFPVAQKQLSPVAIVFDKPSGTSYRQASVASSRSEVPPSSSDHSVPTIDRDSIGHTSTHYACDVAHDTPKCLKVITRDFPKGESVRIQGKAIMTTMGPVTEAAPNWVSHQIASKMGFGETFLSMWTRSRSGVKHYDYKTIEKRGAKPTKDFQGGRRWIGVPEEPTLEAELYTPFVNLISAVLRLILKHGPERQVYDTHDKQFPHFEKHHSSPDIVVRGTGPSFEMPANGTPVGYSNIVTFVEVKLDGELGREQTLEQVVVYLRQIFIHQPNRMFARCVLLSQKRIQLIHVDHAGIQRTPFFDINKNPAAFLGILLVTTTTANVRTSLGLDDTIHWKLNDQGWRESGSIRMLALDRARTFDIVGDGPISHHRHIRGSGTVCWKVSDPEASTYTEYTVKDTWSSEGRTPEWELFQRAKEKGIRGVAVMVWYEECIQSVSEFRCESTIRLFFNRIFSRLVMETYGMEVENFKSVIQLLRALRDALAAHGNLYGAGILHRDISNKTILLGREGAPVGDQGILTDLSVAFDYHRGGNSVINKEPLMTSRFFQSCAILDFLTDMNTDEARELAPAHDYLDDLESFFLVLCFLLFGFLPNGEKRAETDKARSVIKGWDSEDPDIALARKNLLLSPACRQRELAIEAVANSWGEACATLFEKYMDWVVHIRAEKTRLRRENYPKFLKQREELLKAEEKRRTAATESKPSNQSQGKKRVYLKSVYATLYLDAQKHYDQLLEIFQTAIIAVETSPAAGQDAPKVSILADPTVPVDQAEPTQTQGSTGSIPLNLGANSKRRRYDSTTENDADPFKVPELPASKAVRLDEAGNGAAWNARATASGSEGGNPLT